ncbi:MAG: GNAT family N-acetyltransferase [Candidatus Hatepunaea meridiana]|nr:GNAT family N-acetyltransferase [Candidatus Hatepunaea meridiana]
MRETIYWISNQVELIVELIMVVGEKRLPHRFTCQDGTTAEIKLLTAKDIPALRELYKELRAEERSRIREDVLNEHYEKRLTNQIKDENIFRIVAWQRGRIFASMTVERGFAHWLKHTCELRTVVHPDHRRIGIATHLLEEAIRYADSLDIEKLYINLMSEQTEAIRMAETLGFRFEAVLRDHVKDSFGTYHNIQVYSMDISSAKIAMEKLIQKIDEFME